MGLPHIILEYGIPLYSLSTTISFTLYKYKIYLQSPALYITQTRVGGHISFSARYQKPSYIQFFHKTEKIQIIMELNHQIQETQLIFIFHNKYVKGFCTYVVHWLAFCALEVYRKQSDCKILWPLLILFFFVLWKSLTFFFCMLFNRS